MWVKGARVEERDVPGEEDRQAESSGSGDWAG